MNSSFYATERPIDTVDIKVLFELTTKLVPLAVYFNFSLEDKLPEMAKIIEPEPDEKLINKIVFEMICYFYFLNVHSSKEVFKMFPDESHFISSSIRRIVENNMEELYPSVYKQKKKMIKRIKEFISIEKDKKKELFDIVDDNAISMAGKIMGKEEVPKEFLIALSDWCDEFFEAVLGEYVSVTDNLREYLKQFEPNDTQRLMLEINEAAPIPVLPPPEVRFAFLNAKSPFSASGEYLIISASDSGKEAGGIVCEVSDGTGAPALLSLTHLEIKGEHPLKQSIENYKEERIAYLKEQDKKAFSKSKKSSKKNKKKKSKKKK